MKKAFTLVELIVVVGIIGILMAVLLGTFSGSTESANTAKCQANMHNLAMAVQSVALNTNVGGYHYYPYAGSFDQYSGTGDDRETVQARGWIAWKSAGKSSSYNCSDERDAHFCISNGTLFAAMKGSLSSYVCPSCVKMAKANKLDTPYWTYAMNAYFNWASKNKPRSQSHRGRRYDTFQRADRFLLFAEIAYDGSSGSDEKASDPVLQYKGCEGSGNECIGFNHKDGKNSIATVCFVDGHVEKFRAPKDGSVEDLTKWLCYPKDEQGDFDVSFDGSRYNQVR